MNTETCGGGRGGGSPELSPDGKYVVFATRRPDLSRARRARRDGGDGHGGVPFIKEWGRQSDPTWSPDGIEDRVREHARESRVHRRVRHEDAKGRTSSRRAWTSTAARRGRRTESGSRSFAGRARRSAQQTQQGNGRHRQSRRAGGGRGAAAVTRWRAAVAAAVVAAVGGGRGGRGGDDAAPARADGLYRAAFPGGYTLAFMVADVATGKAQEFWHNKPNDRVFATVNAITWAGDHVVFTAHAAERRVGSLLLGEHRQPAAASRCCSRRPTA